MREQDQSVKTKEFISKAIQAGAHKDQPATLRNLVGIYYYTDASARDLIPQSEVTTTQGVINKLLKGISRLWEASPAEVKEQFPLETILFLKPRLGRKLKEKTREKMREAKKGINNPMRGRIHSEDTRRKISDAKKGITLSVETRRKIGEANKGKTRSEETRRRISETKKGQPNPMLGRTHSEETRRKMSEAHKKRHEEKSQINEVALFNSETPNSQ